MTVLSLSRPPSAIHERFALAVAVRARKLESGPEHPLARYYDDPVGFARDCLAWRDGEGPRPYQTEILGALRDHRRIAIRGPHGLGKTALAAIILIWFSLTREATAAEKGDWKAVTTASAWRQLTHFLWPEVRKWANRLNWSVLGRQPFSAQELLRLNLRLGHGEAFAVASSEPALIEGAHADRILYFFDESKAIAEGIFDAAEGALMTGDAYAIAVSTPGEPNGRFYDIHRRKQGYEDWWVRHVRLEELLEAGVLKATDIEQRRKQWGEQSAVFQNRVLGEFASSEADGVIPLSWVELANERWQAWKDETGGTVEDVDAIGADIAEGGEDRTVFALRAGAVCAELRYDIYSDDVMATTGKIKGILERHGGRAIVDSIGIGSGVVKRLRELGLPVEGFNAANLSKRRDASGELGFVNRRAEAWWGLRERLDPASGEDIALPPDDILIGDLTAPRWRVMSRGRIQIESKADLRKADRLGRSTDAGDAVVMAFASNPGQDFFTVMESRVPDCPECGNPCFDGRFDLSQPLLCEQCNAVVLEGQ